MKLYAEVANNLHIYCEKHIISHCKNVASEVVRYQGSSYKTDQMQTTSISDYVFIKMQTTSVPDDAFIKCLLPQYPTISA